MRTCPNCGYQVENDRAKFCKQCGVDLSLPPRRPSQDKPAASGKPAVPRRDAKDSGKRKTRRHWYIDAAFVAVGLALCVLLFVPRGGRGDAPGETFSSAPDSAAVEAEVVDIAPVNAEETDIVPVDADLRPVASDTEESYICSPCGLEFETEDESAAHMKSNHYCDQCKHWFFTKDGLEQHKAEVHASLLSCDRCGLQFKTKRELDAHKRNKHTAALYVCNECGLRFGSAIRLAEHKDKEHPRLIRCPQCDLHFATEEGLAEHERVMHTVSFPCGQCGMRFKTETELAAHKRDYHPTQFTCYVCGAKFRTATGLQQHSSSAHRPAYRCEGCGMTFSNEAELQRHRHATLPKL